MSQLQLFAVTESGPQPLALPKGATNFDTLYDGLSLGVYSALRTFDHNKFLCLADHLARMERSMVLMGWDFRLDRSSLCRALHQVSTASPWPAARIRFDVLAEPAWPLATDSRVLIALAPFVPIPQRFYDEGVAVAYAPDLKRRRPLAKTADFPLMRRAYAIGQPEAYECLLLDNKGHILEGSGSNFYGVRDGVVWTAGQDVLEGIARKIILELLPRLDIPFRLEAVHVDEIPFLSEAAISSSSRALLPVVRIAGQTIGDGRPGPIWARILAAYNDFVVRAIKTAV
jgi:branched-subunit amino acid aminotransferase/4-amino-4-deoxychorismate lyase